MKRLTLNGPGDHVYCMDNDGTIQCRKIRRVIIEDDCTCKSTEAYICTDSDNLVYTLGITAFGSYQDAISALGKWRKYKNDTNRTY